MATYRIEYYDNYLEENAAIYYTAHNIDEAVKAFRIAFDKDNNQIIEISKVIKKDWSKM